MFPLIPVDKVFARLSVATDPGVEAALTSALEGAYTFLETALSTHFVRNDYVDLFSLDPRSASAYGGLIRLKLNNGFVVPASVAISLGDSIFGTSWESATAGQFLLLAEKGFVDVPESYLGKCLKVSYDAGFDYDPGDTATTYAVIPEWLQEAAMAHAIKIMSMQQIGDENPTLVKMYKMLEDHKVFLLDRRLRVSSRAVSASNQ